MWEQTDELQFVKIIEDNKVFKVIETMVVAGEFYVVDEVYVDLSDYDLEEEVGAYYESLDEIKGLYEFNWQRIVAEIIGENHASLSEGVRLESRSEVLDYLKSNYNITVQ